MFRVSKFCACTKLRVSKYSVFRQSEYSIVAESLNQRFKVLHKEWGYSSFLKPENAILPSREIHVQRYQVSWEQFSRKYQASCEQIIRICLPENAFSAN